MVGIVGIIIIFAMVFGGYIAGGGHMEVIFEAVPFEMITIGGAAVGSFALSNDFASIKRTLKDIGKVFKGVQWKPDDYRDLLCLLFELIRLVRQILWRSKNISRRLKARRSSGNIRRSSRIMRRWS